MALGKPLQELGLDDIQALIDDAWPESDRLELKQCIPGRKGERDRWYTDQQGISEHGRNELLAEVVAFANSQGGDLVIGMAETTDRPARAAHIELVPACIELAHRLELMARDCIEPAIPLLAARGIPTADNGGGVVIVRVPPSRAAPHRLTPTRECYHRRRDRTEKMTMREIQDLTFTVARGSAGIERRLTELTAGFRSFVGDTPRPPDTGRLAIGVVATPATSALLVPNVHRLPELQHRTETFDLRLTTGGTIAVRTNTAVDRWRPMLMGVQGRYSSRTTTRLLSLWNDGSIGWWWLQDHDDGIHDDGYSRLRLYAGWLLGDALNVAAWADRYRAVASGSSVEYALRVEVSASTAGLVVFPLGLGGTVEPVGTLAQTSLSMPEYSLGGEEERAGFATRIIVDLWNAVGEDWRGTIAAVEVSRGR